MNKLLSLLFFALMLTGCTNDAVAEPRGLIVRFNAEDARTPVMQTLAERHHIKLEEPRALSLGSWLYHVDGRAQQAFFTDLQKVPELDYAEWDATMNSQK